MPPGPKPDSTTDRGKPSAIKARRQRVLPGIAQTKPMAQATDSATQVLKPRCSSPQNAVQHPTQVSTAGIGQAMRVIRLREKHLLAVTRLTRSALRQFIDQTVELFQRSKLDRQLTHFLGPPGTFHALLDAHFHVGSKQIRELFFHPFQVA